MSTDFIQIMLISLLLLEVELMETILDSNEYHQNQDRSLLLLEVELMETTHATYVNGDKSYGRDRFYYWKWN